MRTVFQVGKHKYHSSPGRETSYQKGLILGLEPTGHATANGTRVPSYKCTLTTELGSPFGEQSV